MATPQTTTEPLRALPSAADGVSVVGSATSWGDSAFVELDPSIANPLSVVGIAAGIPSTAASDQEFEWTVATGGAGAEEVIATTGGTMGNIGSVGFEGAAQTVLPFGLLVDNIPTGSRVSTMFRNSPASAETWSAKLLYHNSVEADTGTVTGPIDHTPGVANGVSVTPSSTAWANSAWVQINASLTDVVIIHLVIQQGDFTAVSEFEADIGIGAAGSEVPVATVSGAMPDVAAAPDLPRGYGLPYPFVIPIELAGTNRIAVRLRKEDTNTAAWTFKLFRVANTDFGIRDPWETTQVQRALPDPGPGTSISSAASAWGNGSWVEMSAGEANATVMTGLSIDVASQMQIEVDIGTGAAGLETVVTTFANDRTGNTSGVIQYLTPAILNNIPASTRIACRGRDSDLAAQTHGVNIHLIDLPL